MAGREAPLGHRVTSCPTPTPSPLPPQTRSVRAVILSSLSCFCFFGVFFLNLFRPSSIKKRWLVGDRRRRGGFVLYQLWAVAAVKKKKKKSLALGDFEVSSKVTGYMRFNL